MRIIIRCLLFLILFTATTPLFAQHINDLLLHKVARRFEQSQHLSLQKIIQPTTLQHGQMPWERLPCYSGKQVTIVAVFSSKPVASYGCMLVTKRYPASNQYDEHLFQQAGYDRSFNINYSLLSVYFPPEATFKNCNTVLQVYDKKKPDNKVWLIVLIK